MKASLLSISFLLFTLLSCDRLTSKNHQSIAAREFAQQIKENPKALIVDVRTPEEYAQGHLANSVNINWYGKDFMEQLSTYDRSKVIFVYCLSGGRSAEASHLIRNEGFKKVYELEGGIMKWRAANLPETKESRGTNQGMTMVQFEELLKGDKKVLVDFYAEWCAPCNKMKPFLEEISKEMQDSLILVRINVDEHQELCKTLKIEDIPLLHVYQKGILLWSDKGYMNKEGVLTRVRTPKD